MPCYFPVGTYRTDGSPTYRPCGQCIGCRLEYSRQWAVRCVHEASLHPENCFVTLTFDQEHLPADLSVHKSDLQKFVKRLRKKYDGKSIRYFGSGEYGDKFERPHYHICLFNHHFTDKKIHRVNTTAPKIFSNGTVGTLFISEELSKIWPFGFHTIGEFSFETAAYVARYVTKKVTGDHAHDWYGDRNPEFALMSRNPGIGAAWFEKYSTDCYPKDFHTLNGRKMRPPRYYDTLLGKKNPEILAKIKEKRRNASDQKEYVPDRRKMQKEYYRNCITKRLERKIENGKN